MARNIRSAFWNMTLLAIFAATAHSQPANPMPLGKMVDLGGYRLHLYCTGRGKQTVVLSPGGGDFSFVWYLVQQQLQSSARVCTYDRAGSAWSDPGPQPLTLRQEAYELERALKLSGERGPYVVAGHSIGGLVMMTFAEGYPDETSGIVLVDTPSPDSTLGFWGKLVRVRDLAKRTIPPIHTMETSPPIPITDAERERAMKYKSHRIQPPFDRLPLEIQKLQLWAQTLPPKVGLTEQDDYTPEEFEFLYELEDFGHPFGDKPLVIMIGMQDHASHEEKITAKRAEHTLSTNNKVIEVQDSGHAIHLEDPAAVVAAIRETMSAALHRTPLKQ
ncbi:alpha/beta hydrolase [Terriglobus albidus]|uniref:Alpha/beta hydrolase n=1 Tax=Terriglobus albidus TaxID=1592106 RepID=A0A5B9E8S3_9BACT|nr:alpha/beta hydrolase [Terriglobus albidus]QEE28014.1 alpha/beta hydrolase [Terriglobus albidus]